MTGKNAQNTNKEYLDYVSSIAPVTNETRTLVRAFWVGGLICVIGEFIRYVYIYALGLYGDTLAQATSATLIFFRVSSDRRWRI